eukprot:349782-Chlamydomonas_euryale.AAC.3
MSMHDRAPPGSLPARSGSPTPAAAPAREPQRKLWALERSCRSSKEVWKRQRFRTDRRVCRGSRTAACSSGSSGSSSTSGSSSGSSGSSSSTPWAVSSALVSPCGQLSTRPDVPTDGTLCRRLRRCRSSRLPRGDHLCVEPGALTAQIRLRAGYKGMPQDLAAMQRVPEWVLQRDAARQLQQAYPTGEPAIFPSTHPPMQISTEHF